VSTLPNLGSQVKLRLLPKPQPQPLVCYFCLGRGYFLAVGNPENDQILCLACQGTGFDDYLLAGIMSGELVPPVEE